jgi:hypothetical protein
MSTIYYRRHGVRTLVSLEVHLIDDVVRELEQFRQSLRTRLTKEALARATLPVVRAMRLRFPRGTNPPIKKNGTPRKRIADSIRRKVRRYRDGRGYYAVVGPDSDQRHAHLIEFGTKWRVRKRIGGKYAWMERYLSRYDYLRTIEDTRPLTPDERFKRNMVTAKRSTGFMPAYHIVATLRDELSPTVRQAFIMYLSQKVMRKAERMAGASESVDLSV